MKTLLMLTPLVLAVATPRVLAAPAVSAPALPPAVSAGGSSLPAPSAPSAEKADPMKLARTLLEATKAQTALLQTVVDKAGADAAAPGLLEATANINRVTRQLGAVDFTNAEIEESYMDLMQEMFTASEEVNKQFARLQKAGAFGSEALKQAIEEANKPVFSADGEGDNAGIPASGPLTPEQQQAEIERMERLAGPDRKLVAALKKVVSIPTAAEVVPELQAYIAAQQALVPADEAVDGYFENPDDPAIRAVEKQVGELLQQVRAELLRIVAVDGFDTKDFDPFNDAMDEVFALLEQTHDFWFGDIFDENFQDAVYDILNQKKAPAAPAPKS